MSLPPPLCRLLVVDDDDDVRFALSRAFELWGFDAHFASRGKDAIDLMESVPFDLVMTDLKMPGMSGLELTEEIKKRHPSTEVLIMTAFGSLESAATALKLGAFDYLLKPFGSIDLVRASLDRAREKQRLERELRESRQTFESIVEKSRDGILVVDAEGTVRYANPQAIAFLGGGPRVDQPLPESFGTAESPAPEIRIDRGDEGAGTGSVIRQPTSWEGREAVLMSVRDVTIQRQAEETRARLEQQMLVTQKLESLGVLAGGIAHDFNNLLFVIQGQAELLREQFPAGTEPHDHLQRILRTANHAAQLVKQMLSYAGKRRTQLAPISLSRLIESCRLLLESSAGPRHHLKLELDPDVPLVQADATQVEQIALNLVTNAAEAITTRPGTVRLRTGHFEADAAYLGGGYFLTALEPGAYSYLEVEDDGDGIDPAVMARIFDPFYSTKTLGRGLGLASVMGIVKNHKGGIMVRSEPGRGTTFRILFPLRFPAAFASAVTPSTPSLRPAGPRVLVVDDNEDVGFTLAKVLNHNGYRVELARDGQEAVEKVAANPGTFEVVLMDIAMPRLNGIEAIRKIREGGATMPIILLTGYAANDKDLETATGYQALLTKPCSHEELFKTFSDLAIPPGMKKAE